jgi:hypothetical protein
MLTYRGRRTLNSLNSPIRLPTSIVPPCSWVAMSQLVEGKRGPSPVGLVVKNGWNDLFRRILRRGRDDLDALDEVGIPEHAPRFEKVQYLEQQFVHGGIFGREAEQCLREIKTVL